MYSSKKTDSNISKNEEFILNKYGCILTLEEIRSILKYPTVSAVRKAHSRKTLPVKLVRFKTRQGWFATARSIAVCLSELEEVSNDSR